MSDVAEQRDNGDKMPGGITGKGFRPGQSGNPRGRPPNAGKTICEHLNDFADQQLTEVQLRQIARDRNAPWPKRAAAERAIRTFEAGDISDFAGLLKGENNLEDLRAMGINTEVIRKLKQKTRKVPTGNGQVEEVIEREIELHDRAGEDFDRVIDRTKGRPTQGIEHTGADGGPIETTNTVTVSADFERYASEFDRFARQQLGEGTVPPHRN